MHSQLSVTHLIFNASLFVQFIMLVLFIMFLAALYITGRKWVEFERLKIKNKRFDKHFWSGADLKDLYLHYEKQKSETIERIFVAGFHEFSQFRGSRLQDPEVVVLNCRRAMEAALNRVVNHQERYLNILATSGSSAPYIGLLGTVYGIMTSFIALGGMQQTTIATVAPGIAEALIATAIGLLAAIPSVLSYNYFIAKSDDLTVEYEAFVEEFSNILQRQMLVIKEQMK